MLHPEVPATAKMEKRVLKLSELFSGECAQEIGWRVPAVTQHRQNIVFFLLQPKPNHSNTWELFSSIWSEGRKDAWVLMVFTTQYRQLTFACLPTASPDPFHCRHPGGPYLHPGMELSGSQMPLWLPHSLEQGGEMAGEKRQGRMVLLSLN